MIEIYTDALIISIICSFVIDYLGVVENMKKYIWKWFNKIPYQNFRFKPFDCSLCMSFWITLIYLYCSTEERLLVIMLIAATGAYLAPIWTKVLNFIFIKINDRL